MTDIEAFVAYTRLTDELIERATKDQLADVARLLALNCGYYQARFGDVPQDVLLRMVRKETLDEETAALLVAGMQNLVSVLAEVTGLADDLQPAPHHQHPGVAHAAAGVVVGGPGRVVRIVDTLVVLDGGEQQHKVRLAGIDCPERKQPWGQRAKQALSGYVFDRDVTVDWGKRDRYGLIVGKVLDGERDVNLALVRDGTCWWYRKYADEQSPVDRGLYEAAEDAARDQRRGLWVDPDPIPSWDWRRP